MGDLSRRPKYIRGDRRVAATVPQPWCSDGYGTMTDCDLLRDPDGPVTVSVTR